MAAEQPINKQYSWNITVTGSDPNLIANFKSICVFETTRNSPKTEIYALPIFNSVLKQHCIKDDLHFSLIIIDDDKEDELLSKK